MVFISTPGFFLWALDADTGQPPEDWGEPIPVEGFSQTGGVDMVADLIEGPRHDRSTLDFPIRYARSRPNP